MIDPGTPPYGQDPAAQQPSQRYGQPYPQQPGYAYGYGYGQTHSGATTSLVLGIVSIAAAVIGFCSCFFLGAVGALIGPLGIWQAIRARNEIDAAPSLYTNRGNAVGGLVCSIIGTVIGVLVLVLTVVFIVFYGVLLGASA